jgi:hypothetical protein
MQQGKKLRSATGPLGHKRLMHWCPGCEEVHGIQIEAPNGEPRWSFDGNFDKPTFAPSVRIYIHDDEDDHGNKLPHPIEKTLCHYFINGGMIQFCSDSPHKYSGQTVELPDWPYQSGTYGGIDGD